MVQIETGEGLGSGIVFDGKGNIVTNAHVVGTARTFRVTTPAGKILTGKLVGVSRRTNRRDQGRRPHACAPPCSAIPMRSRSVTSPWPSAIRSGCSRASPRASSAPSAATSRRATASRCATRSRRARAINPGNSGGALVNISGEVIGIPTLAANDPQLGGAAAGIGFAIPGNDVRDYASQIIAHGRVIDTHRAYLGIRIGQTNAGV